MIRILAKTINPILHACKGDDVKEDMPSLAPGHVKERLVHVSSSYTLLYLRFPLTILSISSPPMT